MQDDVLDKCSPELEEEAQRIAAQLLVGGSRVAGVVPDGRDIQALDVNSMELIRPRSVGVEQVGLWAPGKVGLAELLIGRLPIVLPPGCRTGKGAGRNHPSETAQGLRREASAGHGRVHPHRPRIRPPPVPSVTHPNGPAR